MVEIHSGLAKQDQHVQRTEIAAVTLLGCSKNRMRAGRGRGMETPKWTFLRRFNDFQWVAAERRRFDVPRAELRGNAGATAENEDDAEQGMAMSNLQLSSVVLGFESGTLLVC